MFYVKLFRIKTVRMSTEDRRKAEDWFIYAKNVRKCLKIRQICLIRDRENSAIAYKWRDAYVLMQWRGWPKKTRSSPCLLPCRIWSLCAKAWAHKHRSTHNIGCSEIPLSWDGRRWWPQNTRPSPEDCSVTTSNLVVLLQRCLRRCLDWQTHRLA